MSRSGSGNFDGLLKEREHGGTNNSMVFSPASRTLGWPSSPRRNIASCAAAPTAESQWIGSFGSRIGPRSTQYYLHCAARYVGIYDECRVPQFHVRPFAINSSDQLSAGNPIAQWPPCFSFSFSPFSSPSNLPEHQRLREEAKAGRGIDAL